MAALVRVWAIGHADRGQLGSGSESVVHAAVNINGLISGERSAAPERSFRVPIDDDASPKICSSVVRNGRATQVGARLFRNPDSSTVIVGNVEWTGPGTVGQVGVAHQGYSGSLIGLGKIG